MSRTFMIAALATLFGGFVSVIIGSFLQVTPRVPFADILAGAARLAIIAACTRYVFSEKESR